MGDRVIHPHSIFDCPECGSAVEHNYGLAGGGFGPYASCTCCDFFAKAEECARCERLEGFDCKCAGRPDRG